MLEEYEPGLSGGNYNDVYEEIDAVPDANQLGQDLGDGLDPNPWYIYECVPFLKDLKGYEDNSRNENKLLTNFIKEMNKNPIDLVSKFIAEGR